MMGKRGVQRKAQITIFMLIAVLVLLAGASWFVYQNAVPGSEPEVPEDIRPVHTFTTNCLEQAVDDGLRRIGATGGYIEVPDALRGNSRATLQATPIEDLKQPYWWFDGIQAVPSLEFIRGQLEEHVQEETISCLDNYSVFESQFSFTFMEEPSATVTFAERDVQARLDYPMEIAQAGNESSRSWDAFRADVPVRFRDIYELATTIMERQREDFFVERRAIDLLSMDPERIPVTEIEFSCDQKEWQLSDVRSRVQDLLEANIPYIKIEGSGASGRSYVPNPFGEDVYEESYFQAHYLWDIGVEDTEGLRAGFTYDRNWDTILNARPSDGEVLRSGSNEGSQMLNNFCVQISHFTYDLEFPVQVAVTDTSSENEQYAFRFAFKASVDHNEPNRQARGYSVFPTADEQTTNEYCGGADTEVTVFTVDNRTGEAVADVNLSFTCGRYSCRPGQTDWINFGAAAGLTTDYPYCVNGILRGEKEGYLEAERFIQTNSDGESYILFMQAVSLFNDVEVRKHPQGDIGDWELLGPDEELSILIQDTGSDFRSGAVVPSPQEPGLQFLSDKERTYRLQLRLLRDDEVVGGYQGIWTPSPTRLRESSTVTFHIIESETAGGQGLEDFLRTLEEQSSQLPSPELS